MIRPIRPTVVRPTVHPSRGPFRVVKDGDDATMHVTDLDDAVVHIAGLDVTVGGNRKQLCAWCGTTILYDFPALIAAQIPADSEVPPAWPVGALVAVKAGLKWVVNHNDGDQLPRTACVNKKQS